MDRELPCESTRRARSASRPAPSGSVRSIHGVSTAAQPATAAARTTRPRANPSSAPSGVCVAHGPPPSLRRRVRWRRCVNRPRRSRGRSIGRERSRLRLLTDLAYPHLICGRGHVLRLVHELLGCPSCRIEGAVGALEVRYDPAATATRIRSSNTTNRSRNVVPSSSSARSEVTGSSKRDDSSISCSITSRPVTSIRCCFPWTSPSTPSHREPVPSVDRRVLNGGWSLEGPAPLGRGPRREIREVALSPAL